MKRLDNLDYLRGIVALSIMFYHFNLWTGTSFDSETILGRLGIYGVAIFYILSGLTLCYVYKEKMELKKGSLLSFFKKRVLRILPLYWLAIFLTQIVKKELPDTSILLLNITGLFGFLGWDKYLATGAWSLGNELVFYIFFPIFLLLARKSKMLLTLFGTTILLVSLYFSFYSLQPQETLSQQWALYINPLNQVICFFSGFLIGWVFYTTKFKHSVSIGIILLSMILFFTYPASGNQIALVSGWNRIIFIAITCLLCLGCYKSDWTLPSFLHKPLLLIGELSYSLYLLHPIVWKEVSIINNQTLKLSTPYLFAVAAGFSLLMSFLVYRYYESIFVKWGRNSSLSKSKTT